MPGNPRDMITSAERRFPVRIRIDPGTTLVFHQVGKEEPNWTVESVVAPRRVYDPKRVRIQATVAGFGAPAAKRTVSLVLNNKVLQTKTVDVGAGGRALINIKMEMRVRSRCSSSAIDAASSTSCCATCVSPRRPRM